VQARLVPDAPGWSETFYGMLFHPKSMIMALTSAPEHFSDLRGPALSLVFLVFFVIGALRFSPSSGVLSIFTVLGSICNGMALWVTLATIMVTLSKLPKSREVGWNEALVVTGWIFTPLIFMAPISCFKQALGPVFLPVATIPTWWTLFLGLIVFNRTLSTSFVRLLAICMVLPPVLFLIYVFWFGCLACMIVAEILAAMPG
ncbi:MAG: YIP1 family protein, partial [Cyanobacteria bacterium]|nr:YIP1 family protein [Cyanobacteriota bacterium]